MQAPPPVPSLLSRLAITASNINGVLMVSAIDWYWRPEQNSWSLTEVICHLRDVELEVHQFRFKRLIEEDGAFIPGVSADQWAEIRNYQQQNGYEALQKFLAARQDTISFLENLDVEIWERQARHAFFGPTSLHELLHLAVRHDDSHWEQIRELLDEFPI